MDAKLISPFVDAVAHIMPQLGFQGVSRGKLALREQNVVSKGITVIIGMTKAIKGNIAYNMTEATAKNIASTMMMGMPVAEMDEMAQSAISEMVNMVTANAAMNLEKMGYSVDISPPTLVAGENFLAKLSGKNFLVVELLVDNELIEVNVALE